jgi:hypothetical protein
LNKSLDHGNKKKPLINELNRSHSANKSKNLSPENKVATNIKTKTKNKESEKSPSPREGKDYLYLYYSSYVDHKGLKEIEKKEDKKKTEIKTEVKVPSLEANTKKPKK